MAVPTTFVAYVYDADGILSRTVVSDDYADADALLKAHCANGEGAIVDAFDGKVPDNVASIARGRTDDELYGLIEKKIGRPVPPLISYAIKDADGLVFDIVETRREQDPRLLFRADRAFVAEAFVDAEVGDTIRPDGTLEKAPLPLIPAPIEVL